MCAPIQRILSGCELSSKFSTTKVYSSTNDYKNICLNVRGYDDGMCVCVYIRVLCSTFTLYIYLAAKWKRTPRPKYTFVFHIFHDDENCVYMFCVNNIFHICMHMWAESGCTKGAKVCKTSAVLWGYSVAGIFPFLFYISFIKYIGRF